MWTCPKCGREFQKSNQGHYCGKAPENVDAYIEMLPREAAAHATKLRNIILSSVPGINERIAWSMPTFEKDKRRISFAACQKHVSFYFDAEFLKSVQPQFAEFSIKKNTIYLPYERGLPTEAIGNAVKLFFGQR